MRKTREPNNYINKNNEPNEPNKGRHNLERLYGILTGMCLETAGRREFIRFSPSSELLTDLSLLPIQTVVGIEAMPPESRNRLRNWNVNNAVAVFSDAFDDYWLRIERCCKDNGLRVVYLLEENTWKTYLTLFTEKELAIGRAVHIGLMHEAGIIGRMEVVSLENKAYELNLECDYFHDIGIGENTEAVIKGRNIGVAILNLGNAEAIVDRNKIGRDGTLIVQSYAAEAIPEIATVQSVGMQSIQTTLVRDAVPNIQELMRDDRLRVGYKALKTGRITDENPDFIGTWDIRIPPRGLFELFIEKRDGGRIAGRIEDTIGSAKFSGVSAEGRIDFVKQYMESAVDIGGIPDRIEYSGVVRRRSDVTGTFVTGTFVSADAVNIGQFTMSEFKNEKR